MTKAMAILRWLPPLLILSLSIYTFYVFVVAFSTNFLIYGDPAYKSRGALYIAFYMLQQLVFGTCFVITARMNPGRPSDMENLKVREPSDVEEDGSDEPLHADGTVWLSPKTTTYCDSCDRVKPDRTHHCSTCNGCVLRMDHHCIWLKTCVGLRNYHMFILTLFYSLLGLVFVSFALGQQLIYDAANGSLFLNEIQYLIVCILNTTAAILLGGLLGNHIYLDCHNTTKLESLAGRMGEYSLGRPLKNLKAVYGPKPWLWWLPGSHIPRCDDGIYFPRTKAVG